MKYLKSVPFLEAKSKKIKTFTKISKSDYNMKTCGEPDTGSDLHKSDDWQLIETHVEFTKENWENFPKSELDKLRKSGFKYKLLPMESVWFECGDKHLLQIEYCHVIKTKDEWYYVTDAGYSYYQCDQIEGVIDCLNKLLHR